MNMQSKILTEMFGDDYARFAGFNNIVYALVRDGYALSTTQSTGINFGACTDWINININPDGTGLVDITFDTEGALKSHEYLCRVDKERTRILEVISDLKDELKTANNHLIEIETELDTLT